jgi:hypothetical protein
MTLAQELASKGTHFHQGEVVVYLISLGCPYAYGPNDHCPACDNEHVCGKGCR